MAVRTMDDQFPTPYRFTLASFVNGLHAQADFRQLVELEYPTLNFQVLITWGVFKLCGALAGHDAQLAAVEPVDVSLGLAARNSEALRRVRCQVLAVTRNGLGAMTVEVSPNSSPLKA